MAYELGKDITKLFKPGLCGGIDKSDAEGLVVSLKGNKIVKCQKLKEAFGVYTAGNFRRVRLLTGEKVDVTIPEGVITYGYARIKKIHLKRLCS